MLSFIKEGNKTMIKTINFSWNDLKSIKQAERQKAKLEKSLV